MRGGLGVHVSARCRAQAAYRPRHRARVPRRARTSSVAHRSHDTCVAYTCGVDQGDTDINDQSLETSSIFKPCRHTNITCMNSHTDIKVFLQIQISHVLVRLDDSVAHNGCEALNRLRFGLLHDTLAEAAPLVNCA